MEKIRFFFFVLFFYFIEGYPSDLSVSPALKRKSEGLAKRNLSNWSNEAKLTYFNQESDEKTIAIDGNGYYLGKVKKGDLVFPTKKEEWTIAFLESTWELVALEGNGSQKMKVWFAVDKKNIKTGDRLLFSFSENSDFFYIAQIFLDEDDSSIWAFPLGNTSSGDIEIISSEKHFKNIK